MSVIDYIQLQPWFTRLGCTVHVEEIPCLTPNYYCKIIYRNDKRWTGFFEHRNDDNDISFILGDQSPYMLRQECNFDNIHAVLDHYGTLYKIVFTCNNVSV